MIYILQVTSDCPEFKERYRCLEQGLVAKLSSLRIVFDRTAILYLNTFIQGLLLKLV